MPVRLRLSAPMTASSGLASAKTNIAPSSTPSPMSNTENPSSGRRMASGTPAKEMAANVATAGLTAAPPRRPPSAESPPRTLRTTAPAWAKKPTPYPMSPKSPKESTRRNTMASRRTVKPSMPTATPPATAAAICLPCIAMTAATAPTTAGSRYIAYTSPPPSASEALSPPPET